MAAFEFAGWMEVVIAICGLGISLSFYRLSDRILWLVIAFGGIAFTHLGMRLLHYAQMAGFMSPQGMMVGYALGGIAMMVANGGLVCGLYLLFQDLRIRFQTMRKAFESQTVRGTALEPSNMPAAPESGSPTY